MNKSTTTIVVALLIVIGGAIVFFTFNKGQTNSENTITNNGHHDEANNDGHHNKENRQVSGLVDMTNKLKVDIDIKDFTYSESNIKIKKGTKVTWTNQDTLKHNVMGKHEHSDIAHDAPSREEVKVDMFAGQLLEKGETYSFIFNKVGTQQYHCSPHPYMEGSVTVVE